MSQRKGVGIALRSHWIAAIVGMLVLVICGVVASSLLSAPRPSGYLYTSSSTAIFVQMTLSGSNLEGTLTGAYLSSSDPGHVHAASISFTGTLNGSSVTLSLGSALLGTVSLSGTLSGSTLVLAVPGRNGSLADFTFEAATTGAYDLAVTALGSSAAKRYHEEQVAAAQAARAEQRQKANHAVEQAASTLRGDLSTLSSDADFSSEINSVASALATTKAALVQTQQEAQKVEALAQQHPNGDSGTVCGDATANVGGDATANVGGDATADVEPEIQTVQSDISTVNSGLESLQQAEAQDPGYYDPGAPTAAEVEQAISSAQQAIQTAVATTNSDISMVNGYVAAAYQAADQAIAAGNCGPGMGPPSLVSSISANAG